MIRPDFSRTDFDTTLLHYNKMEKGFYETTKFKKTGYALIDRIIKCLRMIFGGTDSNKQRVAEGLRDYAHEIASGEIPKYVQYLRLFKTRVMRSSDPALVNEAIKIVLSRLPEELAFDESAPDMTPPEKIEVYTEIFVRKGLRSFNGSSTTRQAWKELLSKRVTAFTSPTVQSPLLCLDGTKEFNTIGDFLYFTKIVQKTQDPLLLDYLKYAVLQPSQSSFFSQMLASASSANVDAFLQVAQDLSLFEMKDIEIALTADRNFLPGSLEGWIDLFKKWNMDKLYLLTLKKLPESFTFVEDIKKKVLPALKEEPKLRALQSAALSVSWEKLSEELRLAEKYEMRTPLTNLFTAAMELTVALFIPSQLSNLEPLKMTGVDLLRKYHRGITQLPHPFSPLHLNVLKAAIYYLPLEERSKILSSFVGTFLLNLGPLQLPSFIEALPAKELTAYFVTLLKFTKPIDKGFHKQMATKCHLDLIVKKCAEETGRLSEVEKRKFYSEICAAILPLIPVSFCMEYPASAKKYVLELHEKTKIRLEQSEFNLQTTSDITFELPSGKKLYLHKDILKTSCETFKHLLEDVEANDSCLPIEVEDEKTFVDLIQYLYTNRISIEHYNVDNILFLMNKYNVFIKLPLIVEWANYFSNWKFKGDVQQCHRWAETAIFCSQTQVVEKFCNEIFAYINPLPKDSEKVKEAEKFLSKYGKYVTSYSGPVRGAYFDTFFSNFTLLRRLHWKGFQNRERFLQPDVNSLALSKMKQLKNLRVDGGLIDIEAFKTLAPTLSSFHLEMCSLYNAENFSSNSLLGTAQFHDDGKLTLEFSRS